MLKSKLITFSFFSLCFHSLYAQNNHEFSIIFYNVENLFDTIDDPHKNDNQFLPQSEKAWNTNKYYNKLDNISRALIASGKWHMPDIIGICEIENKACLLDLIHKTPLQRAQYKTIHYESPDLRGIDVACAYNPETFEVIQSFPIHITFNNKPDMKTRDILYVTGISKYSNDTLHVFFCHFPSRFGGIAKTEFKRKTAATTLKHYSDSIELASQNAKIIIMGDFNDSPQDTSIQIILGTTLLNKNATNYYGTHFYNNTWNSLDQCIISKNIEFLYNINFEIVAEDFLLTKDSKGREKPFRAYNGDYFKNGYSDHLPVILRIFYN